MPIPLLFIGAAAAASGMFGVGKTVKAGIDFADANSTNKSADEIIEGASSKIEKCRKNCGDAIKCLGEQKVLVLNDSIKSFIQEFEKLKNVELKKSDEINISSGLNEFHKMDLDLGEFEELKKLQSVAASIAEGVASGTIVGAATAFGALGAASTFATASTGTAIATLSGAAATNATLAFFGGGSLAAGGLGMAGGAMVLGGIIGAPALVALGFIVGAKASKNKAEAYTNLAKAKKYEEEMEVASALCKKIKKRANLFYRMLLSLNAMFEPKIYEMGEIVKHHGTDYREFSEDEKKTVDEAMALAGAIKLVLDTPLLDDDGNLTEDSGRIEKAISARLKSLGNEKLVFNDKGNFQKNYGHIFTKVYKDGVFITGIKEFIRGTVSTLSGKYFEKLKEKLIGEYISFSVLDENDISVDAFSEKLCDFYEKIEFKTSDSFLGLIKKYLSDWDDLVENKIKNESTPSEEGQPQLLTRAKKYYLHAIEIKESGKLTIRQIADYSKIMMSLYMAIIKKRFAEIDDFDCSIQCLDLDRILNAMRQKKSSGFLMFGGGAKFDTSDRYSMDTGVFILTIILYYHIRTKSDNTMLV